MVLLIAKKEMRLNLVSFRFVVSAILLFVLVVGSLQMMTANYGRRLEEYSSNKQMHRDDLSKVSNQMQFGAFGVSGDPRPEILGIFAIGLEKEMSRSFTVPGYALQGRGDANTYAVSKLTGIMLEGSKYTNPIFTLFQPPDFIYVINIVLSLLAVLFAFDTISGEKEDQTLRLILTNSVPRDTVLIGKWIGGTLSILIPFVAAFVLGVLLAAMRPYVSLTPEAWQRIALIFLASTLYIAVFYLIGVVFSVFTTISTTSLILSLFAWVIFVLVIPNVAPVVARQMIPIKTPDQVVREELRAEQDKREKIEKMSDEEKEKKFKNLNEETRNSVQQIETAYLNSLKNQTALAENLSRLSPSSSFVYAAAHFARTGIPDYGRLKDEILRYKEVLKEARKKFVSDDPTKPIPGLYIKVDIAKVPEFGSPGLAVKDSVQNNLLDVTLLLLYVIILFMVAFLKFLRYPVN